MGTLPHNPHQQIDFQAIPQATVPMQWEKTSASLLKYIEIGPLMAGFNDANVSFQ